MEGPEEVGREDPSQNHLNRLQHSTMTKMAVLKMAEELGHHLHYPSELVEGVQHHDFAPP